jgi:hypothetical protein
MPADRYEIRPGSHKPGGARYATHDEVLLALKATAKELGLVAKLPAGKHGDHWRASIDGLVVIGDTRRNADERTLETFHVESVTAQDRLLVFAAHIAAIAGTQAVIGATDDEFWFVDRPTKSKAKSKSKTKMKMKMKGKRT